MDLSLLQPISQFAAAIGVCVAAIYYVINLRVQQANMKNTLETRQADILQRHAQINTSQEFWDAWHDLAYNQNFLTYEEWREKYGPDLGPDHYTNLTAILQYYEILGGLLSEGLVNVELLEKIWQPIHLVVIWERVEIIIKGFRKFFKDDSIYQNIEYLHDVYLRRHPAMSLTQEVWHGRAMDLHKRSLAKESSSVQQSSTQ
jgi:hypothetical protein